MKKIKLKPDIDWIIEAIKNKFDLYLDMQTGNVFNLSNDEEIIYLDSEELLSSNRYLQIPDLCETKSDMEYFIKNIKDKTQQFKLIEAFNGGKKGGLSRVKALDGGIWKYSWVQFESEQIRQRLIDWLKSENIDVEVINNYKTIDFCDDVSNKIQVKEETIDTTNNSDFFDIINEFKPKNTDNSIDALSEKVLTKRYDQCQSLKQVIPLQCVTVAWRYTGDYEGEYCTVLFSSVRLVSYESLYWWTNKFLGNQSSDFEKVKKLSIETAKTQKLPLMWGVGHLVKAGDGVCATASHQLIQPKNGFNSRVFGFYPVDEQGNKLEFKSATTLKEELSLTSKQIKQLGEPDAIRKNPLYKNSEPMKLYFVDRVKQLFSIS